MADGRDCKGRFTADNKFGRGSPVFQAQRAIAAALASAVTVDEIADLMRGLRDKAKAGDSTALGLLLAYVAGTPRQAPEPIDVHLPALDSVQAVADALAAIAVAAAEGRVPLDAAAKLSSLVRAAGDVGALARLQERVAALEEIDHDEP